MTFLFKRNVTKMSREWVGLAVTNKKLFFTEKSGVQPWTTVLREVTRNK